MPTAFDIVFPSRGRQFLDGGKNSKFERSLIPDNQSPDCLNVIYGNGACGTRGGSSQLNTSAVGSFVIDGIYTKHNNVTTAETMVVFAGGSMWQLATTTFSTVPSAQSVFTAGARVTAAEYQNQMFIGNGGVTPYKYDGTNFTRHGVPQCTGTVSLLTAAGNIAAGTYMYKFAFVNSFSVLGDVGTATTITAAASAVVSITSIPIAPQSHGVSARRVYRTAVGGTTFKFVATISDNTTTTYTDTTLDAALGANAPTDQGEPPKYSVCCFHRDRLFVNDPSNRNYIWYSELGEPYTFKATNFFKVGDNTGDLLFTISVYQNNLVLGCANSPAMLLMPSTDPAAWSMITIAANFGSKSPFATFPYNNKLMIAAMTNSKFLGFAAISGTDIDPTASVLSQMIAGGELQSQDIEPDMFDLAPAYVGNISSFVFKNRAYIALTKTTGNTTNNYVYVFDFSTSNLSRGVEYAWAPYSGWQASQFTVYGGKLYFGSANAVGLVYEAETTTYTDGAGSTAIDSYFWTKEFSGNPGHESYVKDFRKVKILVDLAGSYSMDLSYRVDSDNSDGVRIPIDLTPNAALWGSTMLWGISLWGAGSVQFEKEVSLGQAYGKRIQFKFSNRGTASQRFKVHGLNFTYNIRGTL